MEAISDTIFLIILLLLIAIPLVVIFRINKTYIKFKLIAYLLISTILTALTMILLAWWADKSNEILLNHYGYNLDGMNDAEFYGKVLPMNRKRVDELVKSFGGIGWPLKAILSYPFYYPYIIIVYLINYLMKKYNTKK